MSLHNRPFFIHEINLRLHQECNCILKRQGVSSSVFVGLLIYQSLMFKAGTTPNILLQDLRFEVAPLSAIYITLPP